MRFTRSVVLGVIALMGVTGAAQAQEAAAADGDELEAAVQRKAADAEADREVIREVLSRPGVREVAEEHGFDADRVEAAAEMLEGEELTAAADRARDLDAAMQDGDDTIVIGTTTLIIALLVLLIILAS